MDSKNNLWSDGLTIADGAMGTWFTNKYQLPLVDCEISNLNAPELIKNIHIDYLQAGARFIRTNTFAMINEDTINDLKALGQIAKRGYELAQEAVDASGIKALIAADFGPVYGLEDKILHQAQENAVKSFIAAGANIFMLETFADPEEMQTLIKLIRKYHEKASIVASFAVSADGFTRKGLSLRQLEDLVAANDQIDVFGLNCGVGPTHLRRLINSLSLSGKPLLLMPNSSYPKIENQRMVFGASVDYFAANTATMEHPRLRILGGCCGTTPAHIAQLCLQFEKAGHDMKGLKTKIKDRPTDKKEDLLFPEDLAGRDKKAATKSINFHKLNKLKDKGFRLYCELNPPKDSNIKDFLENATQLKKSGIDTITVTDSPLAKVKLDPIVAGSAILRHCGLSVLPHLTCRDRNVNALRSLILGAHSEGIRELLVVTGDRIPESERGFIRPVFNVNSIQLLELISQMNQNVFVNDPILLAAAADLNAANQKNEYERILRKKQAGASMLLTQPIYSWDQEKSNFVKKIRAQGLKVLVGLMPLVSRRNADYMSQEVPGITIPEEILSQFNSEMSKETSEKIGIKQISALIESIYIHVDGFYLITPFNRTYLIRDLLVDFSQALDE